MNCKNTGFFLMLLFWTALGSAQVTGSGTKNFIPIWTGNTTLGNSVIFQNGSGVGIGTTHPAAILHTVTTSATGFAILGQNTSTSKTTFPVGVVGFAAAPMGVGVYGDATSTTGAAVGTTGVTVSPQGIGVEGISDASSGDGGNASGVAGIFNGTTGTGSGVIGISLAPKGAGISGQANSSTGVSGTTGGSSGVGGLFDNTAGGNIIIGAVNGTHKFRLDGTGKGFFDGGTQTGGADFAEAVAIAGDRSLRGPGDLLVVDAAATRQLTLADQPYSTLVAGIYSTKPGVLATPHGIDDIMANEIPLAIVGIVPCKVSAENGAIQPGDLLVTSSTPGHAMKGTDRARMLGAVVGKALEPLREGKGVIQVLVTLQ
jgi:trimeric autotransporter adhesin